MVDEGFHTVNQDRSRSSILHSDLSIVETMIMCSATNMTKVYVSQTPVWASGHLLRSMHHIARVNIADTKDHNFFCAASEGNYGTGDVSSETSGADMSNVFLVVTCRRWLHMRSAEAYERVSLHDVKCPRITQQNSRTL